MRSWVQPEILEGSDAYQCGTCGTKGPATKCITLKRAPPVLIVHLKRFSYDVSKGIRFKVSDQIDVPVDIDIQVYVFSVCF